MRYYFMKMVGLAFEETIDKVKSELQKVVESI